MAGNWLVLAYRCSQDVASQSSLKSVATCGNNAQFQELCFRELGSEPPSRLYVDS